jgi:hypothetical protein
MRKARQFFSLVLACSSIMAAQTTSSPTGLARIVVTSSSYYHDPPVLTADDLIVKQEYGPRPISALIPLRGARADLELYVLVANSSNSELGPRFADLRNFLNSQPPTTSIGIAYIQDGHLEVAQRPTHDRELAIQALSPPSGSTPSNPFRPLANLIEGWNQEASRRVVLLISDGIDPRASRGLVNESVDTTLRLAQRAGVTVYAIYHPGPSYLTIDYMTIYSGQVQLAHFASETGGQAYFEGPEPLPSFAPFLANIGDHLANQYLLEFVTNAKTSGTLQDVSVTSKIGDVHLLVPWKVWIPAPEILQSDASVKKAVIATHNSRRKHSF